MSKRGNGEDLTVAHGLWKSSAHKRYDRFKLGQVIDIPRRMLRSRDATSDVSSEEGGSSGAESGDEEVTERVARPPVERLLREHLAGSGRGAATSGAAVVGAAVSRVPAVGASLLPAGWRTESRLGSQVWHLRSS